MTKKVEAKITNGNAISIAPDEIEPKKLRLVVAASSLGTMFEWYDFFIYGLLTTILAEHFYVGVPPAAAYIFGLLTFAIGLAFRPLGALYFGSIGDMKGRKGAFLVTITLMGLSTFAVGLLPDYSKIGIWAPIALIFLRIVQGFALGGEYGGAVIYVAEHSNGDKRGLNTGVVQTAATFGFFFALLVVFLTRSYFSEEDFKAWAWRLPFLISLGLLAIAIWIRMQLEESPSYKIMKEAGAHSKAPLREVFGSPENRKLVLLALFGLMIAQGVIWYTTHFYMQVFWEKQLRVDPQQINKWLLIVSSLAGLLYVFFGWLSDKIGRKPVMLFGMLVALVSFMPGFKMMVGAVNPQLAHASAASPVIVIADPQDCSFQFSLVSKNPDGRDVFSSSCDVAKSYLTNNGIAYSNQAAPIGTKAQIKIGNVVVESVDVGQLDANGQKAKKKVFGDAAKTALTAAGYPDKADPAAINHWLVFAIMMTFVVSATALYGPLAAALVELFPTRIRYTALSVPYHIGTGIFGGFAPTIAFATVTATGDMFSGLWYPLIVTAFCILVFVFFFPETKDRDIHV
jgi:MFS family permease